MPGVEVEEGIIERLSIIQSQNKRGSSSRPNDYLLYPGKALSFVPIDRQRHYPLAPGSVRSPCVHRARLPAARFVNLMSGQRRYWTRSVISQGQPGRQTPLLLMIHRLGTCIVPVFHYVPTRGH